MSRYVDLQTDPDGWITSTRLTDGPRPADLGPECSVDEVHMVGQACGCCHWDGQRVSMPNDNRRLFQRLLACGLTGPAIRARWTDIRACADHCPDLPATVPVGDPVPLTQAVPMPDLDLSGFPTGLTIRPASVEDVDWIAPMTVESKIYGPDEAWINCAVRLATNNHWSLVHEFQGQPLQLELIRVLPGEARFGLTIHKTHERPHWFWREAEAPVFQAFRAAGVEQVTSITRRDRPDWIATLQTNYGAEVVEVLPDQVLLSYPAAQAFNGWPTRRTAGPSWEWTEGTLRVWEGTDADLPAVRQLLSAIPSLGTRADLERSLDEWRLLDSAALLLVSRAGQLESARALRHRRGTEASSILLAPASDAMVHLPGTVGARAWLRAVGYTAVSSFVPESKAAALEPLVRAAGGVLRERHTKFRTPMLEYVIPA